MAPERVVEGMSVRGRRVIVLRPDGYQRDVRALEDPERDAAGDLVVRVCSETAWYALGLNGTHPESVLAKAYLVFAE